jgi:hypothetical protein
MPSECSAHVAEPDIASPSALAPIVVGAAIVAALAGAGITAAIDYPWHIGGTAHAGRTPMVPPPATAVVPAAIKPAAANSAQTTKLRPASPNLHPRTPVRKPPARPPPTRTASPIHAEEAPAADASPVPSPPEPSIDVRYERAAKVECARGVEGLLCRERLRWRLCKGRWNDGAAGATRCQAGKPVGLFPAAG